MPVAISEVPVPSRSSVAAIRVSRVFRSRLARREGVFAGGFAFDLAWGKSDSSKPLFYQDRPSLARAGFRRGAALGTGRDSQGFSQFTANPSNPLTIGQPRSATLFGQGVLGLHIHDKARFPGGGDDRRRDLAPCCGAGRGASGALLPLL